jgi:hypothetical protein
MKDLILVATVGILLVVGWLVFSSSPQGVTDARTPIPPATPAR